MSVNKRGRSLAEVMSPIEDENLERSPAPAEPVESRSTSTAASRLRPGREIGDYSVVPINVLVAPEDRRRLKQLSLDSNLSLQKLGHEAWNLLLHKRGLPALKPVAANVPSGRSGRRSRQ